MPVSCPSDEIQSCAVDVDRCTCMCMCICGVLCKKVQVNSVMRAMREEERGIERQVNAECEMPSRLTGKLVERDGSGVNERLVDELKDDKR